MAVFLRCASVTRRGVKNTEEDQSVTRARVKETAETTAAGKHEIYRPGDLKRGRAATRVVSLEFEVRGVFVREGKDEGKGMWEGADRMSKFIHLITTQPRGLFFCCCYRDDGDDLRVMSAGGLCFYL